MIKTFAFVLITWASNGTADVTTDKNDAGLTITECLNHMNKWALVNPSYDRSGPVPACVPNDVDF